MPDDPQATGTMELQAVTKRIDALEEELGTLRSQRKRLERQQKPSDADASPAAPRSIEDIAAEKAASGHYRL